MELDSNLADGDEQFDTRLRQQLFAAPVTNGLRDRLVTSVQHRLQADSAEQPVFSNRVAETLSAMPQSQVSAELDSLQTPRTSSWTRRAVLVATLAASFIGFALIVSFWNSPVDRSSLAQDIASVLGSIERSPDKWQKDDDLAAKLKGQLSAHLVPIAVLGSRSIKDTEHSLLRGRAYRLDAGDGVGLIVFELTTNRAIQGLSSRFETLPTPSGGWALAAMSKGNRTYVLAVAGTDRQLAKYIRIGDFT